jgi:hypothetical protein
MQIKYDEALYMVNGYQVLDIAFTYFALKFLKLNEANRIMNYLFDNYGFLDALLLKMVLVSLMIYFCHKYCKQYEKVGYIGLILFYNLVLFNNTLMIFSNLAVK